MMTSYSFFGSGEDHCSSQPLWPRMASRAMANTEYFFNVPASQMAVGYFTQPRRARCITSETALPPLRCLRRRLPFCAAVEKTCPGWQAWLRSDTLAIARLWRTYMGNAWWNLTLRFLLELAALLGLGFA